MKVTFLTFVLLCSAGAQAPDFKSATGGATGYFNMVKNNIAKSAEKMPEENYGFKPTPEVRSFGQIIGHAADAANNFCAVALGEKNPNPGIEKSKSSKADLTAALNAAFAYCDKAYAALNDTTAGQTVSFMGERSKLNVLEFNTMHLFEHYGNLVTYMRLKGLVPPSSEGRR